MESEHRKHHLESERLMGPNLGGEIIANHEIVPDFMPSFISLLLPPYDGIRPKGT